MLGIKRLYLRYQGFWCWLREILCFPDRDIGYVVMVQEGEWKWHPICWSFAKPCNKRLEFLLSYEVSKAKGPCLLSPGHKVIFLLINITWNFGDIVSWGLRAKKWPLTWPLGPFGTSEVIGISDCNVRFYSARDTKDNFKAVKSK